MSITDRKETSEVTAIEQKGDPRGSRFTEKIAQVIFWTVVLISAYRFYRLRNVFTFFGDEADNIVFGWLATRGHTLYGSIFSHHTPLAYIVAQITASFSTTDEYWHFRILPWFLYCGAALSYVNAPFFRNSKDRGFLAGASFLFVVTMVIPAYLGNLLLVNSIWACFFVIFINRFFFPFLFEKEITPFDAMVGGSTLVLWVSGSLITFYPFVCCTLIFLVALVSSTSHRKGIKMWLKFFLLSAMGTVGLLFLWMLLYGNIGNFIEQAILFNVKVYSQFSGYEGESGIAQLIYRALGNWYEVVLLVPLQKGITTLRPLHHGLPAYTLLLSLATISYLVFLCTHYFSSLEQGKSRGPVFKAVVVCLLIFMILFLRMQDGGFKDLPFYIVSIGILAVMVGQFLGSLSVLKTVLGLGLLCIFSLPAIGYNIFHANFHEPDYYDFLDTKAVGEYITSHTNEDDTIAVFFLHPVLYLETKREPAYDALFFLPWQAKWEEEYTKKKNTCEQLQETRPKYVYMRVEMVWKKYNWREYASCIDAFVRKNYVTVKPQEFAGRLWEIKTL